MTQARKVPNWFGHLSEIGLLSPGALTGPDVTHNEPVPAGAADGSVALAWTNGEPGTLSDLAEVN